jgi:hypothetical protein
MITSGSAGGVCHSINAARRTRATCEDLARIYKQNLEDAFWGRRGMSHCIASTCNPKMKINHEDFQSISRRHISYSYPQ